MKGPPLCGPFAFLEFRKEKTRFDQFGFDGNGLAVPIEDSDRIIAAGISFDLPIFNNNAGNIEAAATRVSSARARKETLLKHIEAEVSVALQRVKAAETKRRIYRDSILQQSEDQLQIIRTAYQAGEVRLLDLMNQQQKVLEMRQEYIASARQYFVASAELEYALGTTSGEEQQ